MQGFLLLFFLNISRVFLKIVLVGCNSHCSKLHIFNLDNLVCFDTGKHYETTNTIMTGSIVIALRVSLFEILNYSYFPLPFSHYSSLHLCAEAITDRLSDALDQFAFNVNGIS